MNRNKAYQTKNNRSSLSSSNLWMQLRSQDLAMKSVSNVQSKGNTNNGESWKFRTKYIPAMENMSTEELAAYCYSKITGLSETVLRDKISKKEIVLHGDWIPVKPNVEDGFYYFSISSSLYFELTGYIFEESESTENEEVPDAPLSNSTNTQSNENGTGSGDVPGTGQGKGSVNENLSQAAYGEDRGKDLRREKAKERDEYYQSLSQEEKTAITTEANERFYELFELNKGYQITENAPPHLKSMWLEKRDEVLIDKLQIDNAPERIKKLFSPNGQKIEPSQYAQVKRLLDLLSKLDETKFETLERLLHSGDPAQKNSAEEVDIAELIELTYLMDDFTPNDYMEYMNQISSQTSSLSEFRQSVEWFIERKKEKIKETENFESVKTKLFGLEELYKAYKSFKSKESANKDFKHTIGDKFEHQQDRQILEKLDFNDYEVDIAREELTLQMRENGFDSIDQFEGFIKDYEKGFEQATVRLAEDHLLRYRHLLYEEEKKLRDQDYVDQLYKELVSSGARKHYNDASRSSGSSTFYSYKEDKGYNLKVKENLVRDAAISEAEGKAAIESLNTPLVNEEQFEHEDFAYVDSKEEMKVFLLNYIHERYENIEDTWADLQENSEYIYDLDKLYAASYKDQNIQQNSIFGMILADKRERLRNEQMFKTITMIILAIVLTIITLGAAAPLALGAGIASLGISLYSVYEAVDDYQKKNRANNVGLLTDDPSLIWVVIAIAGAVFDVAALAPVFKAAEPISDATKLFNKTGDLDLLKADLAKIDGIKGAIYDNIIKSATLQKQANEMIQSILKPQPGMLKMVIIPGGEEFARLVAAAYYMAKKGVIDFQTFLLELKTQKIINNINSLTPEEKVVLKEAFEQGKNLREADLGLINELDTAIKNGDLSKIKEIISHDNKTLIYSPTRKHQKGGWGTEMDLNDQEALKLLNKSELLGKQRYGYKNGSIYEFQPDNVGGWHGYPIEPSELISQKGGSAMLRKWREEGIISNSEYTKLLKSK